MVFSLYVGSMRSKCNGAKDVDPLDYANTHSVGLFIHPGLQIPDLAASLAAFEAAISLKGANLLQA